MGVRKFRSIDEMPDVIWPERCPEALARAIEANWAFASAAFPRRFPPGVHRFSSAEEAEAWRERCHQADFAAMRARRAKAGSTPEDCDR